MSISNCAIRLDLFDLKNKKWKFSGGHEDINLRTTVFFHKESLKIYLSSIDNRSKIYEIVISLKPVNSKYFITLISCSLNSKLIIF